MYSQQGGPPSASSQPMASPLQQPGTPSSLPPTASQSSPMSGGPPSMMQMQPQPAPLNVASLCRMGQDIVQDLVARAQELFQMLRTVQPPNNFGAGVATNTEKKLKIQEHLKTIRLLFKKLRLIHDKLNEVAPDIEDRSPESLVPMKSGDHEFAIYKETDAYRAASEERSELLEQIVIKNQHLKEIIDNMRNMMWEVNSMLAARK